MEKHFVTVEWCNDGHRGIFCSGEGNPFSKDESHTYAEVREILGPFWMILSPQSEPLSEEEVAEHTRFRPLGEYNNEYGIAIREDTPCDESS